MPQARGVPRTLPPRRLVLVGAAQQFNGYRVGLGGCVDIDLGGSKIGVLGTDHPQQAAHSAVVEADPVVRGHRLGAPGNHIHPGRLTLGIR